MMRILCLSIVGLIVGITAMHLHASPTLNCYEYNGVKSCTLFAVEDSCLANGVGHPCVELLGLQVCPHILAKNLGVPGDQWPDVQSVASGEFPKEDVFGVPCKFGGFCTCGPPDQGGNATCETYTWVIDFETLVELSDWQCF